MFRFIILVLLFIFSKKFNAQSYDCNWIIGYGGNYIGMESNSGLMQFNFSNKEKIFYPLDDNPICTATGFDVATISNKQGELKFYTDGFHIYNKNHKILKNGEHINPGGFWDGYIGGAYPAQNGTLFLPRPEYQNQYYLFHQGLELFYDPVRVNCNYFYYTLIDENGDNDNGEALEKNKIILEDEFDLANLAACRHANGRDWWIIQKRAGEARYFIFLLDPTGVILYHEQTIGFDGSKYSSNGNSFFTRDGTKYIQANQEHHLLIMDFDRCSGIFSNQVHILNKNITDSLSVYAAVSSNSRFLYFCDINRIWQYDLQNKDITKSETLVAEYDGYKYLDEFQMNFFSMQLAPDDKIYISCFASASGFVHRINFPDKQGLDCKVEQRAIKLPAEMGGILPPSAYYKLGPLIGSVCDSIYNVASNFKIELYPNPCFNDLHIEILNDYSIVLKLNLLIYNDEGKLVLNEKFTNESKKHNISVEQWAGGIYFYSLNADGNQLKQGKLLKL